MHEFPSSTYVTRVLIVFAILVGCMGLTTDLASADVSIYVDAKAPPGGDGSDWPHARQSIQDALDQADGMGVTVRVLVAKGTYFGEDEWSIGGGCGSGTSARRKAIILKGPTAPFTELKIHGGFKGCTASNNCATWGTEDPDLPEGPYNQTIMTGDPSDPDPPVHVLVADGNYLHRKATIDGMKVTGGLADGGPACLADLGAGLLLLNVVHVLAENVTFTRNHAEAKGGAVSVLWDDPYPNRLDCRFSKFTENSAARGGALHGGNTILLANVLFRDNGSYLQPGLPAFIAQEGGAIYLEQSARSVTAANCLFYDNVATQGPAVWTYCPQTQPQAGAHVWHNCTMAYNGSDAPANSTAFYISPGHYLHKVSIVNSILWGNGTNTDLWLNSQAVQLFLWGDDIGTFVASTWTGGGLISQDPLFVNPADRGLQLSWGSPCIDGGLDAYLVKDFLDINDNGVYDPELLPLDYALNQRQVDAFPAGQMIDIGAYEHFGLQQQ